MRGLILPLLCCAAIGVGICVRPHAIAAVASSGAAHRQDVRRREPRAASSALAAEALQWITSEAEVALEPSACFDARGRLWVAWITCDDDPQLGGPRVALTCVDTNTVQTSVVGTRAVERASVHIAPLALDLALPAEPRLCTYADGVCCVVEAAVELAPAGATASTPASLPASTTASTTARAPSSRDAATEPAARRGIFAFDASCTGTRLSVGARTCVSGAQSRALDPDIAALADGELVCVWRTPNGASHDLCIASRGRDGWSAPLVRATPEDEWHPRIAPDAKLGAHVVWDAWDGRSFDVWSARVLDGRIAEPRVLAGGPAYAAYAELAAAPDGGAWVAWEESRSFGACGPLRATRALALARIGDAEPRRVDWMLADEARLTPSFPRLACSGSVVALTARVFDRAAQREARRRPNDESLFYANWITRCAGVGAHAGSVDLPFDGGVEATESLLADPRGGFVCVAATDARAATMFEQPPFDAAIEGRWRIGWCRIEAAALVDTERDVAPALRAANAAHDAHHADDAPAARDTREANAPIAARITSRARDATGAESGEARALYFGDLHRHTHQSRCAAASDGTTEDAYRYARGPGALDFIALTDHFQHARPWSWWRARRDALRYDDPSRLVVFAGLERVIERAGHYNEVFVDAREPAWNPLRWSALGPGLDPAFGASGERSLLVPHMLALPRNYVRWDKLDGELARVAEIYQGARGSYEGAGLPLETREGMFAPAAFATVVASGVDVGVIGASDHGATNGGLAGVRAARLDRASIFAALRSRETFACVGRCALDLRVGTLRMGESGAAEADAVIEVRASSDAPVASVELVRDGRTLQRWSGAGARELYVITLRDRFGAALRVEPRGGRVVSARMRASGHTGFDVAREESGRYAEAVPVGGGVQASELVVEVEWSVPEAARKLRLQKGAEPVELAPAAWESSASRRVSLERNPGLDVFVWRVGVPLDEASAVRRTALPGPGVYWARVAFCDGNVGWTSPVRVVAR